MSIAAYKPIHLDNTICIVIGLGLVGQAVAASISLSAQEVRLLDDISLNWNQSHSILNVIKTVAEPDECQLELVWCAGKSGFSASDYELEIEYKVFEEVIESLSKTYNKLAVSLVSSAGGLYEGSGGASSLSDELSPIRPYGHWKLKQERILEQHVEVSRIYRVSSVYGVSSSRSRYGILNALIESTYTERPALIYASASTLRDYVSNQDIGEHIVAQLGTIQRRVEILASGRSTSIDILANLIKRISRRNLKISYRGNAENDKDIVFQRKSLSGEFRSCSLEEGVLRLCATYRAIKFGGMYS